MLSTADGRPTSSLVAIIALGGLKAARFPDRHVSHRGERLSHLSATNRTHLGHHCRCAGDCRFTREMRQRCEKSRVQWSGSKTAPEPWEPP
uniref:Putative secreted protein n=1 Tax=Ixodes ricinus TaxID=34613 RepID=A0A6B0U131_IXORI